MLVGVAMNVRKIFLLDRICLKQPKYPVLFLTTNGRDTFKEPFDVRSKSINGALMHAKAENLLVRSEFSPSKANH